MREGVGRGGREGRERDSQGGAGGAVVGARGVVVRAGGQVQTNSSSSSSSSSSRCSRWERTLQRLEVEGGLWGVQQVWTTRGVPAAHSRKERLKRLVRACVRPLSSHHPLQRLLRFVGRVWCASRWAACSCCAHGSEAVFVGRVWCASQWAACSCCARGSEAVWGISVAMLCSLE